MNAGKGISTKTGLLASGAMLAMLVFGQYAYADPVRISFSGAAGSGYAYLTLAPDPDASTSYQPTFDQTAADNNISLPLSIYDPAGAQHITNASGIFSYGGNNVSITGVIPTSPGIAPPGEVLPRSFSWLTAGGAQHSFDNLFYANGSPLVCPPIGSTPYSFYGGFLDIFGVMFALDNGDVVSLWSDGDVPPNAFGTPGGLTYGLSVFTPTSDGGYAVSSSQFAGVTAAVPEPNVAWLVGVGLLGLFGFRRRLVASRKEFHIG